MIVWGVMSITYWKINQGENMPKSKYDQETFLARELLRGCPTVKIRDNYVPAWDFLDPGWAVALVSKSANGLDTFEEAEFLSEGHHRHTGKVSEAKVFKSEYEAVLVACAMSLSIGFGHMEVWKVCRNSFEVTLEVYAGIHLENAPNPMAAAADHLLKLYPVYE